MTAKPTMPGSVVVGLALGCVLVLSGGLVLITLSVLDEPLPDPAGAILLASTEIFWCVGGAALVWSWIQYRRVRKQGKFVTVLAGFLLWLLSVGAVLGVLAFLIGACLTMK